jgi:hypothetical protein
MTMMEADNRRADTSWLRRVAMVQAAYFVLTGLWPLFSMRTFQAVTGSKTDAWLVKTVGVLVSVIGGALAVAGLRRSSGPEVPVLAIGSAVGLAGIDVVYVAKGRIARIYLLDAVAEAALVSAWIIALWKRGESPR